MKKSSFLLALFAVCASLAGLNVQADVASYPSKPIRILVGYVPGGSTDGLARALGLELSEKLAQPVIVVNRPGGLTIPVVQAMLQSPADGYTLAVFDSSTVAINQFLFKKPPYDASKFTTISMLAQNPMGIIVTPSYPAKTVNEVVADLRAKPETAFASPGPGTVMHLTMELFRKRADLDQMVHVPYKGGAPALQDIMAGHVPIAMMDIASSAALIKGGNVRLIAVTTDKRLEAFPDVPTIAEAAYPGFSSISSYALYGPPGIPPAIVEKINSAVKDAMASPRMNTWLTGVSLLSTYLPAAETKSEIEREAIKYSKIIKSLGLSTDN
ncbi:Bug family tripartite tricarboxylate transporter substrate binding protein [Pollutimonas bauzanensis]|uniref:Tripartite-type tricarboxylate transporter, receptor component TctC n=1 Tax=Pollutimonas bauzanensis TaxID=658167 RepID=A0A1M5ZDZ9_9BURK|nr:tripartite tricarboxylate transporter substrate binding protein [Pollutimonas bauzanensis]SHI22428.1 Tripartite-type tricarboxylate transporter, receptor component TctC [Pollutimonas bauzanensis]